jgi:hypothetical protein
MEIRKRLPLLRPEHLGSMCVIVSILSKPVKIVAGVDQMRPDDIVGEVGRERSENICQRDVADVGGKRVHFGPAPDLPRE